MTTSSNTTRSQASSRRHLLISEVFPPEVGGSGNWFFETYRRQSRRDFDLLVKQPPSPWPGDSEYPQTIHRIPIEIAFRGVSSLKSLREYIRIARICSALAKQRQISVIHAGRPLWEGLVARSLKALRGIPYFCYVHGEDVNVARTSRELILITQQVLNGASKLICNSHFSRNLLLNDWSIPASKTVVLHPGVDTTYYIPNPSLQQLQPSPQLTITTVGRLQERKGHDMVIKALASLTKIFPNLSYQIAGDGGERKRLEALTQSLKLSKHVRFLGEIAPTALLSLYQETDVFVLANRAVDKDVEGFGIVLLEAQSCGVPVIAGNSGGTAETLIHNETGFIVDCTSPEPLAKTLLHLFSTPGLIDGLRKRARHHAVSHFDWAVQTQKAKEIFEH